jgi:DNA-binding NtrC family response regulator
MGGAHILVVDDDGFFRAAVAEALSGAGYRLSFAEDVPSALAVLRSEPVEVVVADHVMPGLAGLARSAIDQASVFRFIEKPFDPVAVRLAICRAVDDLERDRDRRSRVSRGWFRGEACSA